VILEGDLAGINRETTLTANSLSNKKERCKRYETRIRSEGEVPLTKPTHNSIRLLISVLYALRSQKTQRVERLLTCTTALTRSPLTLRDIYTIARGQVKSLPHKLQ